ncbi:ExbD/TolR family protein [candidate division KSB1 bacterium]
MKFSKKSEAGSQISTASMPDIVFMLLFFFMVTTVLREFTGLQVDLPDAEKIEKIESRRHTHYLWIDEDGSMSYDDYVVQTDDGSLYTIAYDTVIKDPQTIMSLKIDKRTSMDICHKAFYELRKANALAINFATLSRAN